MPKGYWIAHNDVQDMEVYKACLAGAGSRETTAPSAT